MAHFKERIEDTQKAVDTARTDIAELMATAEVQERDLSDEETIQLEEYSKAVEDGEKRIVNLELAEKAMAHRVIEKQAPAMIKNRGEQDRAPGEIFFKQATAAFIAHVEKKSVAEVAKAAWPTDMGLHAVIKSAQEPAATDVAGWAQELTETSNQGYMDLLRGKSIAAQLWPVAGFNMNFDGVTGIDIPARDPSGGTLESGWTGERDAIPVRSTAFTSQTLNPYAWGAITTASKKIIVKSTPAIMQILQAGIIDDTAVKLDNDYFDTNAMVAGYRPAGTMHGVTGTAAASGGATVGDDMLTDLRNLIQPIYNANMGETMRIVMHPQNALAMSLVLYNGTYLFREELARGQIFGIPVVQSTNAPTDELWCFDMAQLAVASSAPMVEINDSATLVMVDDDGVAPEMGADYPRDPTGQVGDAARDAVNNPPIRSLFQTNTVAIKSTQELSWKTLREGAVNRIIDVAY